MTAFVRLLVADDQTLVRVGLVALLELEPTIRVVAQASDGRATLDSARRLRPDLILLDVKMPGMDGFEALAELRRETPPFTVVMLSTFDDKQDVARAAALGASGYVLKDAGKDDLVGAIATAVRGGRCFPAVAPGHPRTTVTAREREVLALMAKGRSNREIGDLLAIGDTTVKTHVRSLLAKLGAASRTEALVIAVRRGLVRL